MKKKGNKKNIEILFNMSLTLQWNSCIFIFIIDRKKVKIEDDEDTDDTGESEKIKANTRLNSIINSKK
jgi:hypothetical protein